MQLKDEVVKAVRRKDFVKAEEITAKIDQIEDEADKLKNRGKKIFKSDLYQNLSKFSLWSHKSQKKKWLAKKSVQLKTKVLAREITRLDVTMQPLIQDILSEIIDSSPCFPERWFLLHEIPIQNKTKSVISCK